MLFACFFHVLTFDLYQDNIVSHLADIAKWDHKLLLPPKKTAEASRPRHDNRNDTASAHIKIHISDESKALTIFGIDDFLLFQL